MVKTETKFNLARLLIDIVTGLGQAIQWPLHLGTTLATNAFERVLKVVGVNTEDKPHDGEIPAETSVYHVAKSNLDIAALIYYYTETRSEVKKLLRSFAIEKGLSPEEDLPVLRDTLTLAESPSSSSSAAAKGSSVKDYGECLLNPEKLLEPYKLTKADKEIMEAVRVCVMCCLFFYCLVL